MNDNKDKNLSDLLYKLDIPFKDINLYNEAFTHKSFSNEYFLKSQKTSYINDYDRLEFLGDSVLYSVVSNYLFLRHPNFSSGELSQRRKFLIEGSTLTTFATIFHFEDYILYSEGEINNKEHHKKVLEDVFEAFIGAICLDLGYEFAKSYIIKIIEPYYNENEISSATEDYKSMLQSRIEKKLKKLPDYECVFISKDKTNPIFTVVCKLEDVIIGEGQGHTKKEAQKNAAKDALEKFVDNEEN